MIAKAVVLLTALTFSVTATTNAPSMTTTVAPTPSPTLACDVGWQLYGSNCYKVLQKEDWGNCDMDCVSQSAMMLCIENSDQNDFATTLVSNDFWIGYSYEDSSISGTSFQWNTGCSSSYTNWDSGEPNRIVDDGVDDCVEEDQQNGKWSDVSCLDTNNWCICQKGKNSAQSIGANKILLGSLAVLTMAWGAMW
jgi:hypothetical protein